jgi:hypothetical protein
MGWGKKRSTLRVESYKDIYWAAWRFSKDIKKQLSDREYDPEQNHVPESKGEASKMERWMLWNVIEQEKEAGIAWSWHGAGHLWRKK